LTTEDYATPQRLAMYLEAGWSDFLLTPPRGNSTTHVNVSPCSIEEFVKPTFFQEVATLARNWANAVSLEVTSVCDVGGGTGRTIFELEHQFPNLHKLALVEPSLTFCEWAGLLLASENPLPDLPQVDTAAGPKLVSAYRKPTPISMATERLTILNKNLEECGDLKDFDLVTCLNVVDRHKQPKEIVSNIKKIMSPGGLLILSSPFDFHTNSTPDESGWIEDLDTLFDTSWENVGKSEVFYEFRPFNRKWTRYSSQVIGKRWKAT
jgi:SAM-dependent methyltransferase